jgi:hypothetical protein
MIGDEVSASFRLAIERITAYRERNYKKHSKIRQASHSKDRPASFVHRSPSPLSAEETSH